MIRLQSTCRMTLLLLLATLPCVAVAAPTNWTQPQVVANAPELMVLQDSAEPAAGNEAAGTEEANAQDAGADDGAEPSATTQFFKYFMTLIVLTLLQAVLGFDNLLYISIESKRVEESKQSMVRKWGIGLAIVLRIVLLFVVVGAISKFQAPFIKIPFAGYVEGDFNVHSFIVLLGGGFVIYTAIKEIYHMTSMDDLGHADEVKRSVGSAMFWIVTMNLVFSFDSILSAIALAGSSKPGEAATITTGGMIVMSLAIVFSGIMMIVLADRVSTFLQKNRLYEVLGLFILLIVGVMLVSEGGHLAHLKFLNHPVEPMAKSTFYFVIGVLVFVDIVQGRYQRKLLAQAKAKAAAKSA